MDFSDYKTDALYQKYISTVSLPEFDFIINYSERLSGSTIEFLHHHPLYEIYYVINGKMRIIVHNEEFLLSKGELVYIAPDIDHHVIYEPFVERDYFVFIFNIVAKNYISSTQNTSEYETIKQGMDRLWKNKFIISHDKFDGEYLITEIEKELKEKKAGWNSVSNFLFYQFFINTFRHINKQTSEQQESNGILNMGIEASKYIHMNYQKKITIENIADYLNITPRHVNRVFHSLFGTTFSKTLNVLRIEYAKNYLCYTDYSIEAIAELVGFSSLNTFYKLFKEMENMHISTYRKGCKFKIESNKSLEHNKV